VTTLQLLPSLFSLSLVAAAILAERKYCYKRGQCLETQTEKRVLWFTVNVDTSVRNLLQSLPSGAPHAVHGRQCVDTTVAISHS